MSTIWEGIINFFKGDGLVVAKTISILIFGLIIVQYAMRITKNTFIKAKMEKTISSFFSSIIGVALYFILFLLVAKSAGISSGSFIAVISAVGLAISLALKDSLSNLANGFIILGSKPFVVGDFIEAVGVSGTVKAIGIFNTKLATTDNKIITIPNSQIIGSSVTNYSKMPTRRLEINFTVAFDADVDKIRKIILGLIENTPQILASPEPVVRVTGFYENGLGMFARMWIPKDAFWGVKFQLQEQINKEFNKNGIKIPYKKIDINVANGDGGGKQWKKLL